jgi:DNA helicase HerA-like ATPase
MGTNISPLIIGKSKSEIFLLPKMANRHGLIAGATGTGKTITLRVLAEQFSKIGVPCFLADIKGDLSGLAFPGKGNTKSGATRPQGFYLSSPQPAAAYHSRGTCSIDKEFNSLWAL